MENRRIIVTGGSGFIGVHLVDLLIQKNYVVMNIDIKSPINGKYLDCWRNLSITNLKALKSECSEFDPEYIVHLGAITTQNAKTLLDFEVNIQGTNNILEVANSLKNLKKFIFTSSQYVNSPGHQLNDGLEELLPYGFYGESKLIGEKMTQEMLITTGWTIIRPTTIWGPWHPILADGLWKQITNGRYLHPRRDKAIKAYGYVKNAAWQISRILEIDNTLTDKKVLYIGDENMSQDNWVAAFVLRLTNRKMRRIPRVFLFIMSEIGQILYTLGIDFPLYRSRFRNLITSNPSPIDDTLKLLGKSPILFEDAINETCTWFNQINNRRDSGN